MLHFGCHDHPFLGLRVLLFDLQLHAREQVLGQFRARDLLAVRTLLRFDRSFTRLLRLCYSGPPDADDLAFEIRNTNQNHIVHFTVSRPCVSRRLTCPPACCSRGGTCTDHVKARLSYHSWASLVLLILPEYHNQM